MYDESFFIEEDENGKFTIRMIRNGEICIETIHGMVKYTKPYPKDTLVWSTHEKAKRAL